MKRIIGMFSVAIVLVVSLLGGIALGQSGEGAGVLARLQPMLVQVKQSVPLSVTLGVQVSATETLTVTVPAVVDVDVSVRLDSTMTPVVAVVPAGPALVTVSELMASGEALVDNNDIPYELEGVEGVEVIQWISEDRSDWFWLAGELRNVDEERTLDSVELIVTMYDENGKIVGIESGYMTLDSVEPGGTSPFQVTSLSIDFVDVGRYLVQLQIRFER